MKRTALLTAAAILIALTLGVRTIGLQYSGGRYVQFDGTAAAQQLIEAHGLPLKPNPVAPPKVLSSAVYFVRPGCQLPSIALPFGLSVEVRTLLDRLVASGYAYQYHYLDGTWAVQTRVGLYGQWLHHTVLGIAGRSPYRTVKIALAIADPVACAAPETIEWRRIWLKPADGTVANTPAEMPNRDGVAP